MTDLSSSMDKTFASMQPLNPYSNGDMSGPSHSPSLMSSSLVPSSSLEMESVILPNTQMEEAILPSRNPLDPENDENVPSFTLQIVPLHNNGNTPKLQNASALKKASKGRVSKVISENNGEAAPTQLKRRNFYRQEELSLECEWDDCCDTFDRLEDFMRHVSKHVTEAEVRHNANDPMQDVFVCLWSGCGFETPVSAEMVRHVHFHTFHTKIKCHGMNMLKETGIRPCSLDQSQKNIIPDLSERYMCEWEGCEQNDTDWTQAQTFYWHVSSHPEELRGGPIKCRWKGCKKVDTAVSKLREHMRCHSQERLVGCPTCGGLFANRVKFFDHCKRQMPAGEQSYTCSNCSKKFALERLLRDHMRSHINHYKCPNCDMTCPTPSALNNHVRYRHTEVKPFPCDYCDYRGKSTSDVKSHLRTHYDEIEFKCTSPGCSFTCRAQATLKNHIVREHTSCEPLYACHLCDSRYLRGTYLTKHLLNVHQFRWPSGHSRFRYNRDESTGLYRLQTIRFESVELQDELTGGASLRIVDDDGTSTLADDPDQVSSMRSASPSFYSPHLESSVRSSSPGMSSQDLSSAALGYTYPVSSLAPSVRSISPEFDKPVALYGDAAGPSYSEA